MTSGFIFFLGNKLIEKYDLVQSDNCSFTAFGQPFINHEWLSEIIMAMNANRSAFVPQETVATFLRVRSPF